MSDLSWLNPTPHAIAVYASCSASPPPHATLASRRPATALPGPDFAPADRASFAWRLPSFDHLVGGHEQLVWNLEAQRLGGLEVDHKFILGRCLHREVARLFALENAIYIPRRPPKQIDQIDPVRHQAAFGDHEPVWRDGRQFVLGNQRDDSLAMNDVEAVGHYDEAASGLASQRGYRAFNLAGILNGIGARLHSERSRRRLQWSLVIAGDKGG